ncbi:hypothetical protein C8R44DRAFT_783855 [Mycena epipterygia]|nr:hypothetical protein C8R44DRAFT_783855 [Mycena epipterygia]
MRRDLQRNQTLTMTHDNAAAWAGIGSAVFQLWHQKVVPTSIIGIFSVFLYLGNILVLHITTPALFSLATFNSSSHVVVETQGLPAYNWSIVPDEDMSVLQNFYVPGSLYFLPYVVASNATNLGLHEGTLYDVLNVPAGPGNATVTATGFNITCGYLTDISLAFDPSLSWWGKDIFIANTEAGIISVMGTDFTSSIRLYSTIPIVDSDNNEGSSVELNPPMNTSVSSVQLLQCSQSLVSQTAVVDSQSRQIIPGTVSPEIEKASSMWLPYLIQKLNLRPTNQSHPPENVTLHQLENALSTLVASMFWTLGHIPPIHGAYFFDVESQLTLVNPVLSTPPFPLQGDAIVTGTLTEIRLDIVSGLVASTALTLLSLPSSLVRRGAKDGENITINGTGILHAIWLYRNHPELQTLLEQVEHPTNENLRDAGLVQIRLVGEQVRKQGFDSF